MNSLNRGRLSVMMFLQYFIWGSWWVTLGAWLNANGSDAIIGKVYSAQGWAAIIAPLFLGAIADRFFAAEKLMGVLHICAGITLFVLSGMGHAGAPIYPTVLLIMCLFMPTLPLSNAVAMNAMADTQKEFPAVRVLGTIGWIVAGLLIGQGAGLFAKMGLLPAGVTGVEASNLPIKIAAVASLFLGLFSFTLPHTPPRASSEKQSLLSILGLDIVAGIKDRGFWTFIAASFAVVIPLSFYYAYTNTFLVETGAALTLGSITLTPVSMQTIGQMSEILFMLALPMFLSRYGIKWVLVVGMLAWTLRYLLFAYGVGPSGPVMGMILLGIALHGVCYDFFFVAGQINVDKAFPPEQRARAQSFVALITLGLGQVIGSEYANAVYLANTISETSHHWVKIWLVPSVLAAIVAVVFAIMFRQSSASKSA